MWLGLGVISVVVYCLTTTLQSYVSWRHQRWESRMVQDWSFIQWGEFVTGTLIGTRAMLLLPVVLGFL